VTDREIFKITYHLGALVVFGALFGIAYMLSPALPPALGALLVMVGTLAYYYTGDWLDFRENILKPLEDLIAEIEEALDRRGGRTR
jgi:hypothetical protein